MTAQEEISFDQTLNSGLVISNSFRENSLENIFRPSQPTEFILPNIGMIMYSPIWFRYLFFLHENNFDLYDDDSRNLWFFNPPRKESSDNYKYSILYYMMKAYENTRNERVVVGAIWCRNWLFNQQTIRMGGTGSLLLKFTDKLTNNSYQLDKSEVLSLLGAAFRSRLNKKFTQEGKDIESVVQEFIYHLEESRQKNVNFDSIEFFVKFLSNLIFEVYTQNEIATHHSLVIQPNLKFVRNNINLNANKHKELIRKEKLFDVNFSSDEILIFFKVISTTENGSTIIEIASIFDTLKTINYQSFKNLLNQPIANSINFLDFYPELLNKEKFQNGKLYQEFDLEFTVFKKKLDLLIYNIFLFFGEDTCRNTLNELIENKIFSIDKKELIIKFEKNNAYNFLKYFYEKIKKEEINLDIIEEKKPKHSEFIQQLKKSASLEDFIISILNFQEVISDEETTISIIDKNYFGDTAFVGLERLIDWLRQYYNVSL